LSQLLSALEPADLTPQYELVDIDGRARAQRTVVVREGQGAFRVRVLDAYGRRCSMTGERSLPVLEAAHIQPYLGPFSNHVQNGLALRADLHRLFDAGYVTVTPDYKVEVSRRLREEFDNGRIYYELHGKALVVTPPTEGLRPHRRALDWHATNIFR
jgi:putative restriction endonuclease